MARQPAGWEGRCCPEDATEWIECEVVDISILGLGLTLHHARPKDLLGRRIRVEVPAVSESVAFRLEGLVRNTFVIEGGEVRVGVEFSGLSDTELAIARALGSLTKEPDSQVAAS